MKFASFTSAVLLAGSVAGFASADGPTLQFGMSSPSVSSWNAIGSPAGPANTYSYSGIQAGSNWNISYNLTATDTAAQLHGLLGGSISVLNTSASAQTFSLTILLPTLAQGLSSMTGGSISGVLTADGNGASFGSSGSLPIWEAFMIPAGGSMPGNTIASLMAAPYSVTASPFNVENIPGEAFGQPIPNMPYAAMGDGLGIRLNFVLGAGDKVDFTTALVMDAVIPGPGSAALLSVAGLGILGRRRRR